jgi:multiple sugar transport system substrate-binding protein
MTDLFHRNAFGLNVRGRAPLVSALCLGLAAATPAAATDIDFWTLFTGPDGQAISDFVDEFNASAGAESDVKVNLLIIPWDDFNTKLSVSIASRQAPALTIVNSDQLPVYAKQGALEEFTEDELAGAEIAASDYHQQSWEAGQYDGKQYGIPLGSFPRHIYYNKKLFEQAGLDPNSPPQTGAEVLEDAKAIKALGGDVYGVIFPVTGSGAWREFYSRYWQYSDSFYNADMTDVADDFAEVATKVLTDIQTLRDAQVSPTQDIAELDAFFAQGRVGISFSQITNLNLYRTAADAQGLEYGVAPFPTYGDKPATFAMAHEFLIPKGATEEERAAAMVFIKWVGERGYEWAQTGKVPSKLSVLEDERFKADPDLSTIAAAGDRMHFPPSIVEQPAVNRVVQDAMEAYYAGRTDIEATVETMAKGIKNEL